MQYRGLGLPAPDQRSDACHVVGEVEQGIFLEAAGLPVDEGKTVGRLHDVPRRQVSVNDEAEWGLGERARCRERVLETGFASGAVAGDDLGDEREPAVGLAAPTHLGGTERHVDLGQCGHRLDLVADAAVVEAAQLDHNASSVRLHQGEQPSVGLPGVHRGPVNV